MLRCKKIKKSLLNHSIRKERYMKLMKYLVCGVAVLMYGHEMMAMMQKSIFHKKQPQTEQQAIGGKEAAQQQIRDQLWRDDRVDMADKNGNFIQQGGIGIRNMTNEHLGISWNSRGQGYHGIERHDLENYYKVYPYDSHITLKSYVLIDRRTDATITKESDGTFTFKSKFPDLPAEKLGSGNIFDIVLTQKEVNGELRPALSVVNQLTEDDLPKVIGQRGRIPPAPVYEPKEMQPKTHVLTGQRKLIKKVTPTYTGYRKLFLILCSPADEKFPTETLKHLDTGYARDALQTMVFNVAMALAQKAAPILVCNAYVLENIFLMQYGTEAFRKKHVKDSVTYNAQYKKIEKLHSDMKSILRASKQNQNIKNLFQRYAEVFPHHEEEEEHHEEEIDITEILDYPLQHIAQDFYLYEYHKEEGHTAYLLIPTKNSISAVDALKQHGFNPTVFKQKDIDALKKELKGTDGSFKYSSYVHRGKEYTLDQLNDFSQEALTVVNNALMADDKNSWIIYVNGHGTAYSGEERIEASSIAGLSLRYFTEGLLPIFVDKNSRFCYALTCSIGGINRDRIRDTFNKLTPFEALPKIAQEVLGKTNLQYHNNMITVLGGISDITTMTGRPSPLPTKDFNTFQKTWDHLDKRDPLVMQFLPFVQEVRYDRFFDDLIKRLQAEEAPGSTTRASLEPWKEVLKHVTPYDVQKDQYIYNDIPQIRFPQHDASFNVVDVDSRIQVLRYVDVRARELAGKFGGKPEQPITISNKEMVIVYPLSVNVPLEISGTYPSIVSARSDINDLFFRKISCQGDKNLQNTIHALFTFEAAEEIEESRYFLVEELQIEDGIFKDVLIINMPTSTSEETSSNQNGSGEGSRAHSEIESDQDNSEWTDIESETGSDQNDSEWTDIESEIGSEAGYKYFVKTIVYYLTSDNKLMVYDYDHMKKTNEITIPEIDITNEEYQQAYFLTTKNAIKQAVEEEQYR